MRKRAKDDTSVSSCGPEEFAAYSRGQVACHCWRCATTEKVLNSAGNEGSLGTSQVRFQRSSSRSV